MFVTNLWFILDGDDDRRLVVPSSGPLDPTDRVRHKVGEFVHIRTPVEVRIVQYMYIHTYGNVYNVRMYILYKLFLKNGKEIRMSCVKIGRTRLGWLE